jgi:hypothetical protein
MPRDEVLRSNADVCFKITANVIGLLALEGDNLIPKTRLNTTSRVNRLVDITPSLELRGSQCGGHQEWVY